MEKIFYIDKTAYPSSQTAVLYILNKHFNVQNAEIQTNEHGKPSLKNADELSLHFSVTHSKTHLFIAFSDKNVGIDAERTDRSVFYDTIVKKFHVEEFNNVRSVFDFLKYWTIKESTVKYLGRTLAQELYKISYRKGNVYYGDTPLPVILTQKEFGEHILSIVAERDFSNAEILTIDGLKSDL